MALVAGSFFLTSPETKTKPESATVFVCPEPGCTKTFARFSDFELHLDVGEHVVQNEHKIYDKLKRDWVAMFATVQTEDRQTQHCQTDSTCAHSEKSVPEANMGWALAKARSGPNQFSEKVKDYLTKKFDIGEKTGLKASAEQVAKDMRNARTHDSQRRFGRENGSQNCKSKDSFLAWHLREEGRVGTLTQAKSITKVTKLERNAMLLKR